MGKVLKAETKEELIALCRSKGLFLSARMGHLQGEQAHDRVCLQTMQNAPSITVDNRFHVAGWEGSLETQISVPHSLFTSLAEEMEEADDPAMNSICSFPVPRTFVYFDISDFSKLLPGQQALVISSFVSLVNESDLVDAMPREADLCIGDGYIFVFKRSYEAMKFSALIAMTIEKLRANRTIPVEFHYRMGIHMGRVNMFWDPGHKGDCNYVGDGINGGCRVLEAIGKERDDVIYVSQQVRDDIFGDDHLRVKYSDLIASLSNMGRKADKHGNFWRVWMFDYYKFLSPTIKKLGVKQKVKEEQK